MRHCDPTGGLSVVKHCLTTESRAIADRTIKDSLIVQTGFDRPAVTEASSVTAKEQP